MMFRRLSLIALLGGPLYAQGSGHTVSGVVFDSVAGMPLAGAIVQIGLVGDGPVGVGDKGIRRLFSATADTMGRYRIPGLPDGQFVVGFQHDALNVIGLESPLRALQLAADSNVILDLAIPAGPALRAHLCGDAVRLEGEGMLVGYVIDAERQQTLPGAVVRARWVELALERNNYRAVTRTVTAIVGDDGRYLACGLTSDDRVTVDVRKPGYRDLSAPLQVKRDGAGRIDFRLAASGVTQGTARLAGQVVLAGGAPLPNGRIVIAALGREAVIENGAFAFPAMPAGSWVVETKAVGHDAQSAVADAYRGAETRLRITLPARAQRLDAVQVLGKRGGDARILSAIESRRRSSMGTVFLPGNDWLESAFDPADVARSATGFRYVSPEVLLSSGCGFAYPPPDQPETRAGAPRARTRTLVVYLDGARVVGGLAELKMAVTMRDVLAVEAYQDVATAPVEWRTNDACSVLAIWTRR